jgi:hypothetical protein
MLGHANDWRPKKVQEYVAEIGKRGGLTCDFYENK